MSDSWSDFEKYLVKRIDNLEEKVTKLRITAGMWGFIAGCVPAVIALIRGLK